MNRQTAPYVQAILETALEPWLKALRHMDRKLREDDVLTNMDDLSADMAAKREHLRVALGDAPMGVVNLVNTLSSAGDLHLLEEIVTELDLYVQRAGRGELGFVRSAVPLTADEKRRLEQGLAARFGQEFMILYEVDPTILGGLVVRVGDQVMDGSVATKLANLKEQLA
jgi:F-type H+-transporting ATPase subunit delta